MKARTDHRRGFTAIMPRRHKGCKFHEGKQLSDFFDSFLPIRQKDREPHEVPILSASFDSLILRGRKHRIANLRWMCFLALIVLVCSCEHDFIEDDLTGKTVTILAPQDDDTMSTATPIFWWNEIDGALSYRVQIVYPDFSAPQQLLYDTAVEGDRFYPSLVPGNSYYWRIRPENGSSEGDWVTRRLTIDSSVSLSSQSVLITLPATNGTATSSSTVSFAWNAVSGTTFYRVEIVNTTSGTSVAATTTTAVNYTATLVQGNYEFKVRAENTSSFTAWASRTFSVDQTAPTVPQLIFPADDAFYASPPATIVFDWSNDATSSTDSLLISTDSTFASGIVFQVLQSALQSNYTWTGAQSATTYFWRVRSIDLAGNKSNYSSVFKFVVN